MNQNEAQSVAHLGRMGWGTGHIECVGSGTEPASRMGWGCQGQCVETNLWPQGGVGWQHAMEVNERQPRMRNECGQAL